MLKIKIKKITNQTASFTAIENCVAELRSWMISNMLMVSDSKTEFLIVCKHTIHSYGWRSDHTCDVSAKPGCDFWLQLENGYANHKSLPKCLLSSPQHQENPKIPEPGSHVHDYTCIYYKPDWLLQQFDEWTTWESHQRVQKHSCLLASVHSQCMGLWHYGWLCLTDLANWVLYIYIYVLYL